MLGTIGGTSEDDDRFIARYQYGNWKLLHCAQCCSASLITELRIPAEIADRLTAERWVSRDYDAVHDELAAENGFSKQRLKSGEESITVDWIIGDWACGSWQPFDGPGGHYLAHKEHSRWSGLPEFDWGSDTARKYIRRYNIPKAVADVLIAGEFFHGQDGP